MCVCDYIAHSSWIAPHLAFGVVVLSLAGVSVEEKGHQRNNQEVSLGAPAVALSFLISFHWGRYGVQCQMTILMDYVGKLNIIILRSVSCLRPQLWQSPFV